MLKAIFAALIIFAALMGNETVNATAVNVVALSEDKIVICSDGGAYNPRGELISLASKVRAFPYARTAIGARGPGAYLEVVLTLNGGFTIAEIVKNTALLLEAVKGNEGPPTTGSVVVDIVGFNQQDQVEFWTVEMSTAGTVSTAKKAATDSATFSPAISSADWQALRAKGSPEDICSGALDVQHRTPLVVPGYADGAPIIIAGGFAEVAVVTRQGIELRITRRWNDAIGQRIMKDVK